MDIENETVSEREAREAREKDKEKTNQAAVRKHLYMSGYALFLIIFPILILVGAKNTPITKLVKAGLTILVMTFFLSMTNIISCLVYPRMISSVRILSRLGVIIYYLLWVTLSIALATKVDMAGWLLGIMIPLPPILGLLIALCNKIMSACFSKG